MDDLIKRLVDTAAQRALATANDDPNNYLLVVARISHEDSALMGKAAAALAEAQATIARLEAENARLREALQALVGAVRTWKPGKRGGLSLAAAMRDAAALSPREGEGE